MSQATTIRDASSRAAEGNATDRPAGGFELVDFAKVAWVACPCGVARRGFADVADFPGTVHVTEIALDAAAHFHKTLTETYYFLECEPGAQMQLGSDILDVHPGLCVMIRPGTLHRAIGRMKVLIMVLPKFDPQDEWLPDGSWAGHAHSKLIQQSQLNSPNHEH